MDQNDVVRNLRNHRRAPSSDNRFLTAFSPKISSDVIAGDELNEDDVFWTGDFSEPRRMTSSAFSPPNSADRGRNRHFLRENSGILAALSDETRQSNQPVLYRKPSSARIIPAIPKPEKEISQSAPARKMQQSAPVKVPMMPRRKGGFDEVEMDVDEEEEMLPPHEMVARASGNGPATTFSVLEGVGRTLKGRDLRLVRNAVWRQTGFLD